MTTSRIALAKVGLSGNEMAKRAMDLVGAVFLLVFLSPLFFSLMLLVKLDSRGTPFFKHQRIGKDGKPFCLWKFRSMLADTPPYKTSPSSDSDPRLTKIGRVLRRLSLDELPQLLNVLKGEMSLVGPRPEMPFIVDSYGPLERRRLIVKPGMTGLWQISPARAKPIHDNLSYDLCYIENQSLLLDCVILLRTIPAVIRGMGAA